MYQQSLLAEAGVSFWQWLAYKMKVLGWYREKNRSKQGQAMTKEVHGGAGMGTTLHSLQRACTPTTSGQPEPAPEASTAGMRKEDLKLWKVKGLALGHTLKSNASEPEAQTLIASAA